MIFFFKILKELPPNLPIYLSEKIRIDDNLSLCLLDERQIDSENNFIALYELVMNDYIVPASWKYFLDFIIQFPITLKKSLI